MNVQLFQLYNFNILDVVLWQSLSVAQREISDDGIRREMRVHEKFLRN